MLVHHWATILRRQRVLLPVLRSENLKMDDKITTGELIARFRQMPDMRAFIESVYYDEDVLQASQRFYASEEFQTALQYARQRHPTGWVLDMGGGNGVSALAWHQAGYSVALIEPDMSDVVGLGALTPILAQGGYKVYPCQGIGENLPFSEHQFDIFYSRQVLHHVTDLDLTMREAYRVLKPGGLLLAAREHVIAQLEDLPVFLENHRLHRYTGEENARLLSSYVDAIRQAEFQRIRVLGPWQSAINYYPVQRVQFRQDVAKTLRRYVGKRLGWHLSRFAVVQDAVGWQRSRTDKFPGRMYSFLAVRPQ
jgi:ubiquinone/menaquinone biosynthesis C-methylase UbiE